MEMINMKHDLTKLQNEINENARQYDIRRIEIPEYISDNLKYTFFDWQKDALEYFLTYEAIKKIENPNKLTHLMFNMATGSGKTLLMAATILYYYNQGYRHFIFFVNQNNIVDKTENNFIDSTHTKYLFKDKIVINNKSISIKKVDAFSDTYGDIEIKFTTIQKLYNDIHLERENQVALDDLQKRDIIMIADEAHHLNTDTISKKSYQKDLSPTQFTGKTSEIEIERKGWEHTVIELILNKNGKYKDNKNVLLEFTATIPNNKYVDKKYEDKIVYKFGLKDFLSAGYTKEINLISSTLNKKERVLQALLFNWYRHKIALKNNIQNFKPVILFRSKTILDSEADYEEFLNWTKNITINDFDFLKTISNKIAESKDLYEQGKSRTEQVLNFINSENIKYGEIVDFIKNNFQDKNIIITNSKDNKTQTEKTTEEQEKLLNSLEDRNNHIRAIFTVDRLTEGWDVLNLFDIVRLYQGQNSGGSTKKTPEATIKEKQLIGRGVRYFPFAYNDKIKNKRKFDDDLKNELRILEELYYYTYDEESRYISHLKEELKRDGFIRDDKIIKTFKIKKEFQETDFYKNTKIWYNKQIDNPNRIKKTLTDIKKDFFVPYKINSLEFNEQEINLEKQQEDLQKLVLKDNELQTMSLKFKDIEKHIFYKAINIKAQKEKLFQFETLKEELAIKSMADLQKEQFLGDFDIKIVASKNEKYENITSDDKLEIIIKFLNDILLELKDTINPKKGSEFFAGSFEKFFAEPKIKSVIEDVDSERITEELKLKDWYVLDLFYGTSEEKALIVFIKETFENLKNKYEKIYLLKNEEIYKIYDFDKGRGFEPDFILFLKGKNKGLYYQIFIEPKGNEYLDNSGGFKGGKEGWKEVFLEEISNRYGFGKIIQAENQNYKLIGLPFFNKEHIDNFEKNYQELTRISKYNIP